ncbi:MAG: hypothetical protein FJY65_05295 [Calditrichaeota bacterium]|nr:hypothetical protein [Calditrichota bacterium]
MSSLLHLVSLSLCLSLAAAPAMAIKISKQSLTNPKQAAEQTFKEEVVNKCEFKVKSVEPGVEMGTPKVSLKGIEKTGVNITFLVTVEIINGSAIDLLMTKADFILLADDKPIPPEANDPTATASITEQYTFPKGKTSEMPVKMKVPPEKATERIVELTKNKDIQYRIDGTFFFKFMGTEVSLTVPMTKGTVESKKPANEEAKPEAPDAGG